MSKLSGLADEGALDNRMFSAMRLVLASSALLIITIDPSQPDRYVHFTYGALILYTVYSLVLFMLAARRPQAILFAFAHWIDVGWYSVLTGLSSGTHSIFFFGFLFAVLVASFRWGFASGLRMAIASAMIFTIVGSVTAPSEPQFELNRFLLQPTYLLVLGSMIAYRGGTEIRLRRRHELLKEVVTLSNPRFGVDHTIGSTMRRLCRFYDADTCLLLTTDLDLTGYQMRRADRRVPDGGVHATPLVAELATRLLRLPDNQALIYRSGTRWLGRGTTYYAYDVTAQERTMDGQEEAERVAAFLDAESFITVPLHYYETTGRLYLTARRWAFHNSDVEFLLQVIEHLLPVIDNIRLVDRLASHAAEEERQRIARDIHDSIIQPYIGMRIGLTAVRQELVRDNANVAGDLDHLIEMTSMGIDDLRRYVRGLKDADERTGGSAEGSILSAVRRFATKFAVATGIAVDVEAKEAIPVSDRLAAEVFQMVVEGLSNIRRHTAARQATVSLECCNAHLILRIQNKGTAGGTQYGPESSFTPRSIVERAAALGGHARVEPHDGGAAVVVEIPL